MQQMTSRNQLLSRYMLQRGPYLTIHELNSFLGASPRCYPQTNILRNVQGPGRNGCYDVKLIVRLWVVFGRYDNKLRRSLSTISVSDKHLTRPWSKKILLSAAIHLPLPTRTWFVPIRRLGQLNPSRRNPVTPTKPWVFTIRATLPASSDHSPRPSF